VGERKGGGEKGIGRPDAQVKHCEGKQSEGGDELLWEHLAVEENKIRVRCDGLALSSSNAGATKSKTKNAVSSERSPRI